VASSTRKAIFVDPLGLNDVRLGVNSSCPGGGGQSCIFTAAPCATALPGAKVYVWDIDPAWVSSGSNILTVWRDDAGAPCSSDDIGTIYMTMSFEVP
jgi:hypothetical protein